MSSGDWLTLDEALGYLEPAAVALSLLLLLTTLRSRGHRLRVAALALTAVAALTVGQPFGVKGVRISAQEFRTGSPERVDAERVHTVRVAGVPLFGFRPYRRSILYINGEGGDPTHWLKLRSWLWPGLLTNGDKLERVCGADFDPCWAPRDESQSGSFERASNLTLVRAGDEWRYRISSGNDTDPYAEPGYFRLTTGIVSVAGLVYWLLAGGMVAVLWRRRSRSPR